MSCLLGLSYKKSTRCRKLPNLVTADWSSLLLLLPTPCSCCSPAPHQVLIGLFIVPGGQSSAGLVLGYGQPVLV